MIWRREIADDVASYDPGSDREGVSGRALRCSGLMQ